MEVGGTLLSLCACNTPKIHLLITIINEINYTISTVFVLMLWIRNVVTNIINVLNVMEMGMLCVIKHKLFKEFLR